MKQITYQEAFEALRRAGFAGAAIDRLYHLRQTYGTSELFNVALLSWTYNSRDGRDVRNIVKAISLLLAVLEGNGL